MRLVAQSCLTLCGPMDYGQPGSSVCGTFQVRILEWVAIILQRIFLTQELNSRLLHLLHLQADSLPLSHLGSIKGDILPSKLIQLSCVQLKVL